eukprot:CAMPEP_0197848706 /NCGR_PEP_ID=MMETSP1438-20131217/9710_1 /TAXON_ID=1461541 /ORGANISM="Pterosperma sp., Strain CCMP1384" /LENGTH=110 /DNA_ID=CAMNT_0043461081 /DNA_START=37 /DNA_END=366 /DNA_ORIENTATION=+
MARVVVSAVSHVSISCARSSELRGGRSWSIGGVHEKRSSGGGQVMIWRRHKQVRVQSQHTPSDYTLNTRRRPPANPFDVHVYYDPETEEHQAMTLRADMKRRFPWMRFYQ